MVCLDATQNGFHDSIHEPDVHISNECIIFSPKGCLVPLLPCFIAFICYLVVHNIVRDTAYCANRTKNLLDYVLQVILQSTSG